MTNLHVRVQGILAAWDYLWRRRPRQRPRWLRMLFRSTAGLGNPQC